jgi:type IV pilus assembly protein PilF
MGSPSTFAMATALAALAALAAGSLAGCSAASPRGGPNAEQRSISEYDLARDAFEGQRLREAFEHVQKSLQLNDENADAAHLGAIVLLDFCSHDERSSDCRYPEAERYARKAIAAAPELRDAKNTLGVILVHEGKYDDAIAVLKPLADDILYGSPEKSWGNLGWAYLLHGDFDAAVDALHRAVASQPLFCVGSYRLGLAYEKKGQLDLAREWLTKAVDVDRPECKRLQDAFDARARVAAKQGLRDEARADLERCRDIGKATDVGRRCAAQLQTYQ